MAGKKQIPTEQENAPAKQAESVAPYDILFLTRAHNRGEITFEEWLERATEWAKKMIAQHSEKEE